MATRGQRRHLITLENPGDPVPDGDGGFTHVWAVCSPPRMKAEIKTATAFNLERVVASTVQASASHIVTMDYHPEVTTKTRVLCGAQVFAVTGVQDPDLRHRELVLAVEEVVA